MPASASIPTTPAARPAPGRTRLRPVLFAVLVALVPTAVVAFAVGRNEGNHTRRAATAAVVAEAQAGGREAERALTRARARALAIAHVVPVQRALARRDRAALTRLARRFPGSYYLLHGKAIPGRPADEAARRTVVVTLGKRALGTVAVSVPRSSLLDAI